MLPLMVLVLILVDIRSDHPTGPLAGSDDKDDGWDDDTQTGPHTTPHWLCIVTVSME